VRRAVAFLFAAATLLLAAIPASAHEEINPATIVTGKPVFFTFTAADESTADLNKVTLTAPAGVDFGTTTREPAGWTVNRTDRAITWTGGAVKPNRFEQWGFEIEGADQPGTLSYKVTLGFADGKTDDVTVDVKATADTGSGSSTGASDSSGRANAALGLAVVALVVAVAGLVLAARRRPAGAGGASPAPKPTQDW